MKNYESTTLVYSSSPQDIFLDNRSAPLECVVWNRRGYVECIIDLLSRERDG